MHYVYVLKSIKDDKLHIGFTSHAQFLENGPPEKSGLAKIAAAGSFWQRPVCREAGQPRTESQLAGWRIKALF